MVLAKASDVYYVSGMDTENQTDPQLIVLGRELDLITSSKAAVITFTKCLAAEMAPFGVNVNAISPGWIATEKALAEGRFEEGLKHVPLRRGARPEEVGQAIMFLASPAADFMTGENMVLSGGSVMD